MKFSYDTEQINKILKNLYLVTGLSYAFYKEGKDFSIIANVEREGDEFCKRINSTNRGMELCRCSDIALLSECREKGRPVSHICHAGVKDTVVPIRKDGVIAGFVVIGRIRTEEAFFDYAPKLSWLGDSKEALDERYSRLAYFSEEQMSGLIELVSKIVFDSAVMIEHDDLAKEAEEYIRNNLSSDLSVSALCRRLFISKNGLYNLFRETFGVTVNEYVTERRLERARELILEGESISTSADAVGIGNYKYFSRVFKKHTGISPTEYRKKYKKKK